MVIIGAGMNQWYHQDMNYRSIINMLMMCGTIGVSGGGWAHYVGQEKLRPQSGWSMLSFALDWVRPPRHMNGTSFFYMHSDQWRYEKLDVSELLSPLADPAAYQGSMIDLNVRAERMGWLPSAPQLTANPLTLAAQAEAAGAAVKENLTARPGANEQPQEAAMFRLIPLLMLACASAVTSTSAIAGSDHRHSACGDPSAILALARMSAIIHATTLMRYSSPALMPGQIPIPISVRHLGASLAECNV
jgi:hypothetical protein